ncbi:hypothetical protein UFOVP916_20 [uncultured Caudovirales phage]|uniref:Uncharacterized protein n=1 Tax=uncultured Caudovirales phage TaxID=2100421 RepID=A0A6J5P5Z1_9CAUD|nr:hypothetical protein UFOVP827_41 [uncultured Caudovirales phage]CAB4171447.1 hypothetical protein UFOVP916_20 [uncultured Caudovirales phage]CAB4177419.1 hypothetical protein UFOVP1001_44 [uncultured Caudovirales phage]CAB4199281.1 hypothetical protein UFOVP1338_32 [uncultured Caudovirales phage]CAB4213424.1 hypothetical protein UFOVP1447_27 [uncultured Caudovirales phage]
MGHTKKKLKFKNKGVVDFFTELGFDMEDINNGSGYRIDNKVDVYKNSSKIFYLKNNEWLPTTPNTIIQIVRNILAE